MTGEGGRAILYPEELTKAKVYLRVEDDEEDQVVTDCVLAARAYLAGAGVALPGPNDPRRTLYDLACHGLALGYYERREATTATAENPVLRSVINQLKLTEPPVSNLDTNEGGGGNAPDDP